MRSIFEEDKPSILPEDGLTTRQEAVEVVAQCDGMALGGGCVSVRIQPHQFAVNDNQCREIIFANGQSVNAGLMKGFLKTATPAQIALLKEERSAPSLDGPAGINWHCTETEYYATRQKAADLGLVVQGGGTISEDANDTQAIGNNLFGLPPVGGRPANFVILFAPAPGYEAPVCNAAFLAHMIERAGLEGAIQFVKARSVVKGWRAA